MWKFLSSLVITLDNMKILKVINLLGVQYLLHYSKVFKNFIYKYSKKSSFSNIGESPSIQLEFGAKIQLDKYDLRYVVDIWNGKGMMTSLWIVFRPRDEFWTLI
ncbi:Uncharacterized protein TCM_032803 [Theobroma cacao]|uniref:Uncharacterized protein n=1 Tax=Theobroma cacao TaxID=3641 RepID=A0A061FAK6_THECC|nr:Uncharacterized protein TCM_032803 [Theobroma cacao]